MWTAFPSANYYGHSVALGLAAGRRSRVRSDRTSERDVGPSFDPLYGAFDVKRFPSRISSIVHPYVRSAGPSLRPDHERGRTRGWAEVKDGPQGHRRRRRPASLRSAHPRVTLGWLGSDDWPAW